MISFLKLVVSGILACDHASLSLPHQPNKLYMWLHLPVHPYMYTEVQGQRLASQVLQILLFVGLPQQGCGMHV